MTSASEEAFRKAVATVEAQSSVELVIVVKPSSASYQEVDLALGMGTAFLMLAFLVYSPWPFAWHFLLGLPILTALGITLLTSRLPALQRALSKQSTMDASVRQAAHAAFVDAGVHHTQYRTGVLLYVSQLERSAALVADSAAELAFPPKDWDAAADKFHACMREGGGALDLASIMESSGELFAKHLPPRDDDQNELKDGVIQ